MLEVEGKRFGAMCSISVDQLKPDAISIQGVHVLRCNRFYGQSKRKYTHTR